MKKTLFFLLSLLVMTSSIAAQSRLSGRVTTKAQEPVVGASITVPGTTYSTVTDIDGYFELNVDKGEKLEVNYKDYPVATVTATPGMQIVLQGGEFVAIPLSEAPQKAPANAATRIVGRLVEENGQPVSAYATVSLGNQNISTTTNERGEFSMSYLEAMDEEVIIEAMGYVPNIVIVSLENGQTTDLQDVVMLPDLSRAAQEEVLLNLAEADLNDDEGKSQSVSSASSASQDVFNTTTSFAWSTGRYRNRGYEQRYEKNYINGLAFNTAERGTFSFSSMGGLNDASRNKEVVNNIEAANFTFGDIGNSTNYLMDASRYAQGWKVGVAGTNRQYKGRVNATYATGPLNSGWSFIAQIAWRYSPYINQKGIIGEGIAYNSGGYFLSAQKDWQNGHRLSLITFGAPTERGQSGAVTQEVYDLTGSINYNPYWGYCGGKVRNSRIVKSFDPTGIVSYEWQIDPMQRLRASAGYHYAFYSNSALTFYNAPDPRPDYYRNLPSFLYDGQFTGYGELISKDNTSAQNPLGLVGPDGTIAELTYNGNIVGHSMDMSTYQQLTDLWKSRDNKTTQIDWDGIYAANQANNLADPTASASYIQERRHNDLQEAIINLNYSNSKFSHLKITAGLDGKFAQGIHYKSVDDLLGGYQWIDVDAFAERDIKDLATNIGLTQVEIENVKQNDIYHHNQVKHNGDRFGYNYYMNMIQANVWAQNEWTFNEFDFYYALKVAYSSMQRNTTMINGRAWYLDVIAASAGINTDRYYGKNAIDIRNGIELPMYQGFDHHFVDPAFKMGFTYKINGRNRIKFNAIAQTEAPLARDAYVSARVHDAVINSIYTHDQAKNLAEYYAASQKIVGGDLTYEFNYPIVRGRITAYYTQFWNGSEMNGYYDDNARTFVNQTLTGIDRVHRGIEAAAAVKLGTYFTLTGAVNASDQRYTSNAFAHTSAENGMSFGTRVDDDGFETPILEFADSIYMKGLHVANGPQLSASLKLSFFHSKMWFADITCTYYDWNYLDIAPSRRMKGLYYGTRDDGSSVNGWYGDVSSGVGQTVIEARVLDENKQPVCDKFGTPLLQYPYNLMTAQESLVSSNVWNRFVFDLSVGKLIYLPNRQQLSINLSVTNFTNNTKLKTGGYQQARLPRSNVQQQTDDQGNAKSVLMPNAWKFPSKYYYAWGANFYLSLTYKF
ncbi:MAG: carboxypeptidase-like regulatory domain-containing protein [Paludibacteraceae bacterium]|nr:carboxypeptidase-like regulatory domain-containing protein [Paludibacteraceae bacterium]